MKIEFHVPAIPVSQPRPRAFAFNGKARIHGAKKEHPIHAFKATVRAAAAAAYSGPPLEGPLRCDLLLLFPRTTAQRWKKKPMPRLPHAKKPDRDNCDKAVMDALSGLVWVDDSQVFDGRITKMIASGDEQPGVYVTISEVGHSHG